jgi:hypothetical protein
MNYLAVLPTHGTIFLPLGTKKCVLLQKFDQFMYSLKKWVFTFAVKEKRIFIASFIIKCKCMKYDAKAPYLYRERLPPLDNFLKCSFSKPFFVADSILRLSHLFSYNLSPSPSCFPFLFYCGFQIVLVKFSRFFLLLTSSSLLLYLYPSLSSLLFFLVYLILSFFL